MATISTMEFLQALYPEPLRPGKLLLWTSSKRSGKKHSYWLNTLDEAARHGHRLKQSRDVYFGVALQDALAAREITRRRWPRIQLPSVRGCEDSAVALPALFAELGAATVPGTAPEDLPGDRRAPLQLLEAVEVPVSIIVHSAGGYQVYWLLRDLWILESETDRSRAKDLLRRLEGALRAAARARGWPIEVAADLARVLRLPGTFNLGSKDLRPVTVEQFPLVATAGAGAAGDHRYQPNDFDALPEVSDSPDPAGLLGEPEPDDPADFKAIYEGCGFISHCYEDRRRLPEPEWQEAIDVIRLSAWGGLDGRHLAHRFSRDHPGYNPRATDERLDRALPGDAPSCRRIAYQLGAYQSYCSKCVHFGRVEGPLDLGRPRPAATVVGCEPAAAIESAAEESTAVEQVSVESVAVQSATVQSATLSPAAEPRRSGAEAAPAQIVITGRDHPAIDQALADLAARDGDFSRRAGVLVHVMRPDLVRSCVVWLGLSEGAEAGADSDGDSDGDNDGIHDLIHGLAELIADRGSAATAKEILDLLASAGEQRYALLRSALAAFFPELPAGQLPSPAQLAVPLRYCSGRILGGASIERGSRNKQGFRWLVRRVADHELRAGERDV